METGRVHVNMLDALLEYQNRMEKDASQSLQIKENAEGFEVVSKKANNLFQKFTGLVKNSSAKEKIAYEIKWAVEQGVDGLAPQEIAKVRKASSHILGRIKSNEVDAKEINDKCTSALKDRISLVLQMDFKRFNKEYLQMHNNNTVDEIANVIEDDDKLSEITNRLNVFEEYFAKKEFEESDNWVNKNNPWGSRFKAPEKADVSVWGVAKNNEAERARIEKNRGDLKTFMGDLTTEQKEAFVESVELVAKTGVLSLSRKEAHLNAQGAKVAALGPLKYLGYILFHEDLKGHLKTIQSSGFKWSTPGKGFKFAVSQKLTNWKTSNPELFNTEFKQLADLLKISEGDFQKLQELADSSENKMIEVIEFLVDKAQPGLASSS